MLTIAHLLVGVCPNACPDTLVPGHLIAAPIQLPGLRRPDGRVRPLLATPACSTQRVADVAPLTYAIAGTPSAALMRD